eukprot:6743921-Alexandrium_andersonii.AAC.1
MCVCVCVCACAGSVVRGVGGRNSDQPSNHQLFRGESIPLELCDQAHAVTRSCLVFGDWWPKQDQMSPARQAPS